MATKIGLGTGVKWAQLSEEDLPREIKKRVIGGGARNPHSTAFSLARQVIAKPDRYSELLKRASAIPRESKRLSVVRALKNAHELFPAATRTVIIPPSTKPLASTTSAASVGTRPHLIVEEGKYRHHIGFWNNEYPDLRPKGAIIGALLMRQYCETKPGLINTFDIVDLRSGISFSFPENELDDHPEALHQFMRMIDQELKKI